MANLVTTEQLVERRAAADILPSPSPTSRQTLTVPFVTETTETGSVRISPQLHSTRREFPLSPSELWRSQRRRIGPVYLLRLVENGLRLAQPFILGWAINDLIRQAYYGLMVLVVQHLLSMMIASLRQKLEARAFGEICPEATTSLLAESSPALDESQAAHVVSRIRESLGILEHAVPVVMHVLFSIIGAMLMLGWYDVTLVPLCLALIVPASLLNNAYGRRAALLNRHLRSTVNDESTVLSGGSVGEIRRHLEALAGWRIKLSDSATVSYCLMELFVLGVLATALVHFCLNRSPQPGDIFAVLQYVLIFISGLRSLPYAAPRIKELLAGEGNRSSR